MCIHKTVYLNMFWHESMLKNRDIFNACKKFRLFLREEQRNEGKVCIISHTSGTYPDFQLWSNVRTYFFLKIPCKNSTDLVRDFRQQLSIFGAVSILKSNYSWCLAWLQLWHPSNRSVWFVIYPWETITHESSPICCLPWKSYIEFSTYMCYMLYWSTINKPRQHELPYPVKTQTPMCKPVRTEADAMWVLAWDRHKHCCSL